MRREKGAWIQWEEDSPPGNCCSSRKQPERLGSVTAWVEASGVKGPEKGISEHAGRNMSERRAGLETANACAEPAIKGRRPPLILEVSNTRTGPSRRGSDVDMRVKGLTRQHGRSIPVRGRKLAQLAVREDPSRARVEVGEAHRVAVKRVTIVERRGLGSRVRSEGTRARAIGEKPSNLKEAFSRSRRPEMPKRTRIRLVGVLGGRTHQPPCPKAECGKAARSV